MGTNTPTSHRNRPDNLGLSPRNMVLLALGILGVVITVDALTPYDFGFSVLYVLPVLILTWAVGWKRGLGFAVLSAGLWYAVDWASGHPHSHAFFRAWDAFNYLIVYALVAIITGMLREVLLREHEFRRKVDLPLMTVPELEALLPVCVAQEEPGQ